MGRKLVSSGPRPTPWPGLLYEARVRSLSSLSSPLSEGRVHVCEHAGKMGTQNISQSPYKDSLMEMTEMMGSVKVPKVVFFKKTSLRKK